MTAKKLTRRQLDILPLVAEGLGNEEIGAYLFIGAATVRSHMTEMMERMGVTNRTALVTAAFRAGLLR